MEKKIVSIIIPVYNVGPYIARCIESVVNQSYTFLNIICVCDPSEDNTFEVLYGFAQEDDRIVLEVNGTRRGLSYNRNRGIELSFGEYVYFLDSDDWLEDNAIETMVQESEKRGVQILGFSTKVHYENENQRKMHDEYVGVFNHEYTTLMTGLEAYTEMLTNGECYSPVWHYFFSREFLHNNNLYFCEGALHEDMLFYPCMFLYAERVAIINQILHNYLRRSNSITDRTVDNAYEKAKSYLLMYDELMTVRLPRNKNKVESQYLLYETKRNFEILIWKSCCELNDILSLKKLQKWAKDNGCIIWMNSVFDMQMDPLIFKRDMDEIVRHKKVYIYGAGRVARKIICKLTILGLSIDGVLVTKKENEGKCIGFDPIDIARFDDDNIETIIVLGVGKKNATEIERLLHGRINNCKVLRVDV